MNDVEPNLRETAECGCGCGVYGTLKSPWSDGSRCVARRCHCKRCTGRANRKRGLKKQTRAAKGLGIPVGSLLPSNEESMRGVVRIEVKSGGAAKTVDTFYRNVRAQSDAAKSIGDHRAFVGCASPSGSQRTYYVIRDDELAVAVAALAVALFSEEGVGA